MLKLPIRIRSLAGLLIVSLTISPVLAGVSYTVKSGDTLSSISKRYSISSKDIAKRNNLKNPKKLRVGQVLDLPEKSQQAAPTSTNPRELAEKRARMLAEEKGKKLVSTAQKFLGTPYSWSGTSSRGIDCSGLVMRSMQINGRKVPHNAAALYKLGTPVTYKQLTPGDLVFFITNRKSVSHVGIWVGDNKFIHASSRRGVIISPLEGYYSRTLVGARRL